MCGADVGPVEAACAELGADGVGEDDGPGAAHDARVVAVCAVVDVAGRALGAHVRVDHGERCCVQHAMHGCESGHKAFM